MASPATANRSQEDLSPRHIPPTIFHNFMRAFYPFNPGYPVSDSTVILPLNEGDVILIHSIHPNGWADGTLLTSRARGWLPTNYCEAYEPEDMCNLLKALLNFYELPHGPAINKRLIFGNQELIKGIIDGVRFLLEERTNCLNRESCVLQRSESLRKCHESLLSELSLLANTVKHLQERQKPNIQPVIDNDIIDKTILKAFIIVTKGVRFLDLLEDSRKSYAPPALTSLTAIDEASYMPLTTPADQSVLEDQRQMFGTEAHSQAATSVAISESSDSTQTAPIFNKLFSSLSSAGAHMLSRRTISQATRMPSNISHRISLTGPSPLSRTHHLVSEHLHRSHDTFLSRLGYFVGRLYLQSQSRNELASGINQSAMAGGKLLSVIDRVCGHMTSTSHALKHARATMFDRIQDLVFAARDILINADTNEAGVIIPESSNILLIPATNCVRAAGECVAKAKAVIERIGDFEFETWCSSLGMDLTVPNITFEERVRTPFIGDRSSASSVAGSQQTLGSSTPAPRRMAARAVDKPLPEVPQLLLPQRNKFPTITPSPLLDPRPSTMRMSPA
ncbi:hypothetical protein ACKAV7_003614 [Fusarium commune]